MFLKLNHRAWAFACICLAICLTENAFAAPEGGREKILMDFDWKFHLGDAPDAGTNLNYPEVKDLTKTHVEEIGQEGELANVSDAATRNSGADISFVQPKFDDSQWRQLDLPHDWAVELPFDEKADVKHGFKPVGTAFPQNSIGWYRKEFDLPKSDKGKVLWLEFDGVYRNSLVWLNGHCLGRHLDGYSSFRYDISQYANYGGKNELVVRVDATRFEGWFYEGAGIYRHVWLEKTSPIHFEPDSIFITTPNISAKKTTVHIEARVANDSSAFKEIKAMATVYGPPNSAPDGSYACVSESPLISMEAGTETNISFDVEIPWETRLWSPEKPDLHSAWVRLRSSNEALDDEKIVFGIRTVAFDATNGFLLNGKPYLIKGTCDHQDHAGVGSAMPDALQYYRVKKLKELGSNAIRTSHNPPTPELLEACDRLGMLVMDETRRMDTNAFALDELKSLILRDRNHPSVFMWSLGNEEFHLQSNKPEVQTDAVAIATVMQNLAHQLDPTRLCTIAMNGGWGDGFSKVIDVQGFNYHTGNIDKFRDKFPSQPTIGSEVASTRTTRGIYFDDKKAGYVAAYGENGVSKPWGWWPYFATHPFTSGGFVWTGFDYRGEPTPYKWPCINSHFGIMDMCGFPKDIYYYYLAWWTDKPVLHIAPHWNWSAYTNSSGTIVPGREGQTNLVRVFSNCKEIELFLNGKSLGRQTMSDNEYLDWNVIYEPGVLSAKGFDANGKLMTETQVETTGAPAAIQLSPDRTMINADGEDCSVINVSVVDAQGRVVPVADNMVQFHLSGPGKIIGVGNGDPSSHEPDKCEGQWQRSAFSGYAQIIVQSSLRTGEIQLDATSSGLRPALLKINSMK